MKQVTKGDKFTIVTRDDIAPGDRLAQSVHALADFSVVHVQQFKEWQQYSNYICCLESSVNGINRLIDLLDLLKIKYHVFCEPDLGDEMTAIAVASLPQGEHKQIFKNFKLSLS